MDYYIDVSEHLTFENKTGKILLNEQRVILMGADALGTLRNDLISALGINRAKGFLLRYGWNCGSENAVNMKSVFPFDSELDWVKIGPQLHEITGNVKVEPFEINYNPLTGDYYAEGLWHHSYEAEQHIKHFGVHHEPVCFTLSGYAGGYVSKHLGKKVIFKEVECIGKGDSRCHWIAKPVGDWGNEISNEVYYYQEENLALELETAYMRIENQKEMLKLVLKINEQLSKALLNKEGLSSIISILGRYLKTSVLIEDCDFQLLESYGLYKNHSLKRLIYNKQDLHKKQIKDLLDHKRTVHFSVPSSIGWAHERLITPIIVNDQILGYISLIQEAGSFDELAYITLERTATICAIHMLNEKSLLETEQRIKGEFLDELLNGNSDLKDLTLRMNTIGHDLNQPHYIFVFNLSNQSLKRENTFFIEVKKQIVEMIYSQIKGLGQSGIVSSKIDQIIALVPSEAIEKLNITPKDFGILLIKNTKKTYPNIKAIVGISLVCKHIKGYKRAYEEAKKAVELSSIKEGSLTAISFEELGLIARICSDKNIDELRTFALELLNPLVIYDQENRSELTKTLYYYFDNQGNVLKTARAMFMSPGSIKYRLKRIEEITLLDFTLSQDFFDAQVALQILLFLGITNIF